MNKLVTKARELALKKLEEGKKCIMVLFPSSDWGEVSLSMGELPFGIYVRFSNNLASLKSLPVDTLIAVNPDSPAWNRDGVDIVFEKLKRQKDGELHEIWRS